MMTTKAALQGRLLWKTRKMLKHGYELQSDETPAARISWMKEWGTLAEAQFADGRYTFKRNGMWKPYLTVRAEGTPYDIARMELRWMTDSVLKMQGGTEYKWSFTSMWRQEWEFRTANGTNCVTFRPKVTKNGLEAEVTIGEGFHSHPDTPLLVLLGWYLVASSYSGDGGEAAMFLMMIG